MTVASRRSACSTSRCSKRTRCSSLQLACAGCCCARPVHCRCRSPCRARRYFCAAVMTMRPSPEPRSMTKSRWLTPRKAEHFIDHTLRRGHIGPAAEVRQVQRRGRAAQRHSADPPATSAAIYIFTLKSITCIAVLTAEIRSVGLVLQTHLGTPVLALEDQRFQRQQQQQTAQSEHRHRNRALEENAVLAAAQCQ